MFDGIASALVLMESALEELDRLGLDLAACHLQHAIDLVHEQSPLTGEGKPPVGFPTTSAKPEQAGAGEQLG